MRKLFGKKYFKPDAELCIEEQVESMRERLGRLDTTTLNERMVTDLSLLLTFSGTLEKIQDDYCIRFEAFTQMLRQAGYPAGIIQEFMGRELFASQQQARVIIKEKRNEFNLADTVESYELLARIMLAENNPELDGLFERIEWAKMQCDQMSFEDRKSRIT